MLNLIPGVGPILAQWRLFVVAGICLAIGWFVWDWEHRGAIIAQQQVAVQALSANLVVKQQQIDAANDALKAVTARLADARVEKDQTDAISQQAHDAPTTDDAPLAPVLASALARLRALQQPSSHP